MTDDNRLRDLEGRIDSLEINVWGERQLWALVRDHAQRFDTLQTPFWKRLWFWIDGWPWHDLNGQRKRRPWHRD